MYFYVTLVVLPVITNYIRCDSTTEIQKDKQIVQHKELLKTSFKDTLSTTDRPHIKPTLASKTFYRTSDIVNLRNIGYVSVGPPSFDLINKYDPFDLLVPFGPTNLNFAFIVVPTELVGMCKRDKQRSLLEVDYPRYMLSSAHLTKLAKTLSLNFDPSFSKDYFEPFERRPRPVTIVAFRKNGFDPKHVIKFEGGGRLNSLEVAELQSPYNDVGVFWQELPGGDWN